MNYTDIKQVFPSTSSLTMASYFSAEDQTYLSSEVTLSNFPFGKSDKDSIQISVFTFDGTTITSSYFVPSGTHLPFTKSYYNVFNKYTEYSYSSYQSDLVIVGNETKSVFLDVVSQLNSMGVQTGNYKVGIQLMRDIVGSHSDSTQRLLIDTISPSRTEIALIPTTNRSQNSDVNDEFYAYSSDKVIFRDVVDALVSGISRPEIYKIFYSVAAQNPDGADRFMFDYGIKQGVDAVNFLTDIYYGVKKGSRKSDGQFSTNDILGIFDQFSNWAYQNYNSSATFQEIRDQYYSFFRYIVDQELNRITNKKPDDYEQVVAFLASIYYDSIFYPVVSVVEDEYVSYISGYFKNFINLGDQKLLGILNKKAIPSTNPTQHDKLIIKLSEALSSDIKVGQQVWITNTFASAPILQNVYFFLKQVIKLVTLRGPNLLAKFENEGNTTETLSIEELIGETGSLYNELLTKLATKTDKIDPQTDYRYFENFVNFSSADLRLKTYDIKIGSLIKLESDIQDLNSKLTLQPSDEFYINQKQTANNQIDAIKASFDGYENFLYLNQAWYKEHTREYNGVSSASLYDSNNQNSLVNNVPSFMVEDSGNSDYTLFVGMIGHYFDNLSIFIKQFTEKNNTSSSPNVGISMNLAHDALVSLGWDPEISKENLPLLLGSFSKADFSSDSPLYDKVGNMSENDRNKLIWKRILNSLPFIYKTKGTKASVNAIISCFGIPKNLIKIKEYGSIENSPAPSEQSLYIFDEDKYLPHFSGSGEYFQLAWTGSVNTVEFDFSFDVKKTSIEGQVFRLISCDNSWVMGVYREKGMEWGRIFMSIGNGTGSVITSMTQKVPVFDGNAYTVMLRKNDIGNPVGYPIEYEIQVRRSDFGRITFAASSSFILSGSYNSVFESGSNLFIGNYNQSTASLGVDPEAFWGNIDEVKLWEVPIDNNSFDSHALHRGGYNYSSPDTMVDKLLYRISFNQPINLNSYYGTSSFNNMAFRDTYPSVLAINFPNNAGISTEYPECDLLDVPVFPYQFSINNVTQAVKVSTYGSQTMRSNKIAHVNQTLISSLSSDGRSTLQASLDSPIDSNKVGVFFSPIDSQNEEILKFFGDFNFGDLIGDPQLTYQSTYRQFEQFRQIYYDQGFGIVDYQSFMNLVKVYFDKSMFKYISEVVPARSNLISGILVEPSILERPKLQLKPVSIVPIDQSTGTIDSSETIIVTNVGQLTQSISIGYRGTSILNDVNHMFYKDSPDPYGFEVYSSDGVFVENNNFYRVDVVKVKKAYQTQRKFTLADGQLNDYEKNINLRGTVQTISRSYYELNLIQLPVVSEYPFTASWGASSPGPAANPSTWYFSGSVSIQLTYASGYINVTVTAPHSIRGISTGSLWGFRQGSNITSKGIIVNPMEISASFHYINSSVLFSGYYDIVGGTFDGLIIMNAPPSPYSIYASSQYHTTIISSNPTSSIFQELIINTSQSGSAALFTKTNEVAYRKAKSLEVAPANRTMLQGYFPTHYKYKKQVFSQKEVNSFENVYNQSGISANKSIKWKRGSQSKRTTVDNTTGNLNNTDPVERKSA